MSLPGGTSRPRAASVEARLARLGFVDPIRARRMLDDPAMTALVGVADDRDATSIALVEAMGRTSDPDQAVLGLLRVSEAVAGGALRDDPEHGTAALVRAVREDDVARLRLTAVLGGSSALADYLVSHPRAWRAVANAQRRTGDELRDRLVSAVQPATRGTRSAYDALRIAYRAELLAIAALDLTSPDPVADLPVTAETLAQLAEAALEAALAVAREEYGPGHEDCRLAVIGMGKTGGGELNYISDVDVIFVAEPAEGVGEDRALEVGTALATGLMKACSATTGEGSLWPVDAALRPEGKAGPLVRTVASHVAYYRRWAKTWEFQALLKAWVSAGDRAVGMAYKSALSPMVWEAAGREHFVEDVQAMRRRVEGLLPAGEAARQLKLGPGGLRDVEFAVQLLQLVHGRYDASLRSATTLEALGALAKGGYVGRDDAAELDEAYRFLRTLEHRIQLAKMRRTHLMPVSPIELRALGRSVGFVADPASEVQEARLRRSRNVRRLHERLFYRPLLSAAARLSTDDSRLSPEAARARLAALGFRDPAGAMRHLESLTLGVSRRAAIQRQLLPVMLGWFADEADPDAGLLAFRRVSDELGTIHWYLKMLRDEGSAAENLARVLGRSRYAADLLLRAPESVSFLGDPAGLAPRDVAALTAIMRNAAGRRDRADEAIAAVRGVRRHELLRVAFADLVGGMGIEAVGRSLSDIAEATIEVGLEIAIRSVEHATGEPVPTAITVIGMGSLGGRELGYASDADAIVVHQPHPGASEEVAQARALAVVQELIRLLAVPGAEPPVGFDTDLRPEGKNGPLVRSLESYAQYYARWAQTWEFQALTRARCVAGSRELGDALIDLVEPLRWRPGGLTPIQVREIRTMKARVEAERLPRGADPRTHVKLGRGGLTDVQWTVQLLQLQHAYAVPALRVTGTVEALTAATAAGLLTPEQDRVLRASWMLASELRNAGVLWRGRAVDSVPADVRDAGGMGRIIGREPGAPGALVEEYLRVARRARAVVDDVFYGAAGELGAK